MDSATTAAREEIYFIHTHAWVRLDEIKSVHWHAQAREATVTLKNGMAVLAQGDDVAALRRALGITE